jgi:hypothetical protein
MTGILIGIALGIAIAWTFLPGEGPTWFAPIRTKIRTTLGLK